MIFHPINTKKQEGSFVFCNRQTAVANAVLCKEIFSELWRGFAHHLSTLQFEEEDALLLRIESADPLPLDGNAYSINVTPTGVCVNARSEKDLILGFMTLIDRIYTIDKEDATLCAIDCCQILESPLFEDRMIHYCVFPGIELWEIERFIRLCGALRFSHIVLEFWGTLRYDCLKELSWSSGFSKEEIRPLIRLANDLGIEIVPMFNHWGHASASRVMHGKHVVLDQNPTLSSYFSEDGWCWELKKEKVRRLLQSIREELCELCGKGSYFHIGCDEAYRFDPTEENLFFLCNCFNEISDELTKKGRRAIMWGDMLLHRDPSYDPQNKYTCNAPSKYAEDYFLSHLSKNLLIADWQYKPIHPPVQTSVTLKNAGFDVLVCPWDLGYTQLYTCNQTVKDEGLFGILHTTWHTLSRGFPMITVAALCGFESLSPTPSEDYRTMTAALLRKVFFVDGDYEKAGWSKTEIADCT